MKKIYELLGLIGMVIVLVDYFLVSSGRLSAHGAPYQLMNLAGAVCLVVNACSNRVWAFLVLNAVWAYIALYALYAIASR